MPNSDNYCVSDLDFDLYMSLKVVCNGAVRLLIQNVLLVLIDTRRYLSVTVLLVLAFLEDFKSYTYIISLGHGFGSLIPNLTRRRQSISQVVRSLTLVTGKLLSELTLIHLTLLRSCFHRQTN